MGEPTLSPCPFCGGPAIHRDRLAFCADCECPGYGIDATPAQWNRRAPATREVAGAFFVDTEPEWREVEAYGERVRYRFHGGEYVRAATALETEYWHDRRQEWRAVPNWSSREWFALGMVAGAQLSPGDRTER